MKKNYVTPEMKTVLLEAEDVLTNSPATLKTNEFEREDQWWIEG